nr:MAG TPA: hypothetical protein [Caudoviricetes sp.]
MIKLKTLLYLIPRYQLIEVTYYRRDKPQIQETAIKEDLMQKSYVSDYVVTSVQAQALQGILYIKCEERRKKFFE